jgi:hypothetical protein
MQQELLVELDRCLTHQEIDNHDQEDKGYKDSGNDESDVDEDDDNDNEGTHNHNNNINGAARLCCPKCKKKFTNPKGLSRHYPIHVQCIEICCDRIFTRVSVYLNHKCESSQATSRRETLKAQSVEELGRARPRLNLPKRRRIHEAHHGQSDPSPANLTQLAPGTANEPSRVEGNLSARRGMPISVSNTPAMPISSTASAFPIHPAATFPTYGSGARAPLMFKGTMSGSQHSDMVFPSGQMAFFCEDPESTLQIVGSTHSGTQWMGESRDFSVLNPEM